MRGTPSGRRGRCCARPGARTGRAAGAPGTCAAPGPPAGRRRARARWGRAGRARRDAGRTGGARRAPGCASRAAWDRSSARRTSTPRRRRPVRGARAAGRATAAVRRSARRRAPRPAGRRGAGASSRRPWQRSMPPTNATSAAGSEPRTTTSFWWWLPPRRTRWSSSTWPPASFTTRENERFFPSPKFIASGCDRQSSPRTCTPRPASCGDHVADRGPGTGELLVGITLPVGEVQPVAGPASRTAPRTGGRSTRRRRSTPGRRCPRSRRFRRRGGGRARWPGCPARPRPRNQSSSGTRPKLPGAGERGCADRGAPRPCARPWATTRRRAPPRAGRRAPHRRGSAIDDSSAQSRIAIIPASGP